MLLFVGVAGWLDVVVNVAGRRSQVAWVVGGTQNGALPPYDAELRPALGTGCSVWCLGSALSAPVRPAQGVRRTHFSAAAGFPAAGDALKREPYSRASVLRGCRPKFLQAAQHHERRAPSGRGISPGHVFTPQPSSLPNVYALPRHRMRVACLTRALALRPVHSDFASPSS